jgi:hypothetical protein
MTPLCAKAEDAASRRQAFEPACNIPAPTLGTQHFLLVLTLATGHPVATKSHAHSIVILFQFSLFRMVATLPLKKFGSASASRNGNRRLGRRCCPAQPRLYTAYFIESLSEPEVKVQHK